jgi:hypothetical protein
MRRICAKKKQRNTGRKYMSKAVQGKGVVGDGIQVGRCGEGPC